MNFFKLGGFFLLFLLVEYFILVVVKVVMNEVNKVVIWFVVFIVVEICL